MATLDDMIQAVLKRDGNSPTGESLVIHNHLVQQRMFGIRRGVEFYPNQDDDWDTRIKFIQSLHKANKINLYLDRYWDVLLCTGQILFYLRPTGESYRIYFYEKDEFRAYYNGDGDLEEVVIIYSYKVRSEVGQHQVRWIRLRIRTDKIYRTDTEQKPSFDGIDALTAFGTEEVTDNTLSFIPCVVVNNYTIGSGQDGIGEFDWLKDQIESHEDMMRSMTNNLKFFGNPTLVSTRSRSELVEAGIDTDLNSTRPTLSSNGGWYGSTISTRKSDPFERGNGGERVKRVIGNVQPDERFGYVAPDPTSPDHSRHIAEVRESIHYALGGIDELGLKSGATAYEMKTIYGKVAATAAKKCLHLYDYGLCKVFELALAAEEKVFRDTLAAALKKDVSQINDDLINQLMEKGKIPKGVFGLPPGGDRTVKWRFTGPVFEDSPQDILQKSIVVRNLQELGVQSLEGLKFLFADKTEKELLNILAGGYPFRYIQAIAGSASQMLGLLSQMIQTPDPANPDMPLAASMNITPLLQSTFETIYKELNYGKQFDPADPISIPSTTRAAGSIPATSSSQPDGERDNASSTPTNGSYAAAGINPPTSQPGAGPEWQSLEGSIQQGGQPPEYSSPIPVPGGTVNSPTPTVGSNFKDLQQWGSIPTGVPTDLAANPSLLQQLFPTFTNAAKSVGRRKRKGVGK